MRWILMAAALSAAASWSAPPQQNPTAGSRPLTPVARTRHPALHEISGMVRSRTYPDTFWVHNDSGDEARIFAIRSDGSVIMPEFLASRFTAGAPAEGKREYPGVRLLGASNVDWEDIAIEGDTLYVADMGNNGNARRDLGLYELKEPNPAEVDRARVTRWIPVAFADQDAFPGPDRRFDCEAAFAWRGRLYFLTKHRARGQLLIPDPETGTNLYSLESRNTGIVNRLKKVDSRAHLGGWVTAADMSEDGKTLAVLTHFPVASVWLFAAGSSEKLLSSPARRLLLPGTGQVEALCWEDGESILVMNEPGELFRLRVKDFSRLP